jgi:hypothetical protein
VAIFAANVGYYKPAFTIVTRMMRKAKKLFNKEVDGCGMFLYSSWGEVGLKHEDLTVLYVTHRAFSCEAG